MNAQPLRRRNTIVVALSIAVAIGSAGCSGAAVASTSPATVAPVTATAVPEATMAAPTGYADWVARQGFGGSSGLPNILKLAKWLTENESSVTIFELTGDQQDIKVLIRWLDLHPATTCWAANHDAVRASLATLDAEYDRAIAARSAGPRVPDDIADAILAAAQTAFDEPVPSDCP